MGMLTIQPRSHLWSKDPPPPSHTHTHIPDKIASGQVTMYLGIHMHSYFDSTIIGLEHLCEIYDISVLLDLSHD